MNFREYVLDHRTGADLTAIELVSCVNLLRIGDAVSVTSAQLELPKANVVALVRLGTEIVGLAAIKQRRRQYALKISKISGFKFPIETLELGYVTVHPSHRGHGLSHKLVGTLLASQHERIFATTSRQEMKATLARAGFVRCGQEWNGRNSTLSLWVRAGVLATK